MIGVRRFGRTGKTSENFVETLKLIMLVSELVDGWPIAMPSIFGSFGSPSGSQPSSDEPAHATQPPRTRHEGDGTSSRDSGEDHAGSSGSSVGSGPSRLPCGVMAPILHP